MTSKIVILADGGYFDNLNYYLINKKNKKLSLEKLSKKIVGDKIHLRTKYYNAYPYQSDNPTPREKENYKRAQQFFYSINKLKNHEFVNVGRVKPKFYECPHCKKEFMKPGQKGVDVGLALDLVKMARKKVADKFVLISGDEDLTAAVEMAQEELCNVIVYYTSAVYYVSGKEHSIYGSVKLNNMASYRVRMDLAFLESCAMD
ncbi:MAG TPA: NYN domain-containing protein [Candidatus Atribacteria bacterium]|nr:NYN domain-containing protein [Candidatus Atribacteria bacterium]